MGKRGKKTRRDPREERLEKGRTLLAAWGIHDVTLPAGTTAATALEKLTPFIGREPACDMVIAGWLARFPDPAVAGRLVEWEAATGDKELRREIRRSLFKLEQKGVRVERPQEPRPAFSLQQGPSEPKGYLGAVDGEGSRMAWLLKSDRGTLTGLFTVINDREGMTYVDAVTARRQALMATIKDTIGPDGPLVEVPWTYVHALMGEAFRRGAPRPGNMKADYLLNRGEIAREEPGPVPPCPVLELIPGEETSDPELLEKSADLFREREFGTWVLPGEMARKHIESYASASSSGLIVSKEAATERVVGIMDEAMEEFLGGELRTLTIHRLEETAWVLHLKGREHAARMALAVARALSDPGERRMKDVSFLRAYVFRAFAPYLSPREEAGAPPGPAADKAEGSSRIIDPAKVRALEAQGGGEQEGGEEADDGGESSLIIRP